MTTLDLLFLRWRQWRSGTARRGLRMLVLGLFGAYVGFFVGWTGLAFPETVAKSLPGQSPVRVLNEHLLTVFAGLIVVRFFLQRFDGNGWRPLLSLPVPRPVLARAIQITSTLSLLTLLSLVGLVALLRSTVAPAASVLGAGLWTAGGLLALSTTHFVHTLLRAAWARRAWGIVVGVGVGVVGVIGADLYGLALVRKASGWFFGGLQHGHVLPLLVLSAGTIGIERASTAILRRFTYDWVEGPSQGGSRRRSSVLLRGWGPLSALVLLEATLILRNRGPREQLLAGMGAVVFFVGLTVEGASPLFATGLAPFMIGLLLPLSYGQFAFAWHGGHFDRLLVRVPTGRFVRATLLVIGGLGVGPLLLALPVVGWGDPLFAAPILAFTLYHAGVTAPVMVWTSMLWNRTWVNPEQSRFTFAGGGPLRGLVLMPLLGMPPVLLYGAGGGTTMLLGVAGLGLAGLGTGSFWLPVLETALRDQRHEMLRGFRGGWISPHEWHW